jgi:NTE family protein
MIRHYITIIILCFIFPLIARGQGNGDSIRRPKIALVLSGGGAKGFAHIGVLKVLEEEGIPIDMIVGTSIGSLVGGIYSIGYTSAEIEDIVKSLDWETVLGDELAREFLSDHDKLLKQRYIFSLPISGDKKLSLPQGLIRGQNVLNILCGLSGNIPSDADFSQLPISFACLATDLETGNEVIMNNGSLATAMFSSMAIPIAFQSSERDGKLLADGGLVNNFPTDVAKKLGADIIIGVDIQNDLYNRENLKTINNVLNQLIGFFDQEKDSVNKSLCDLLIRPDISGYSMSSFNNESVDSLIIKGEIAAENLRNELREFKKKYGLRQEEKSRKYVSPERWKIVDLKFIGNEHLSYEFLKKATTLEIPGNYTPEEIKTAVDRIYGLGGFERVYFDLIDTEQGKILNFNTKSKRVFTQNIGFKANTTDAAAIMLNTTLMNYNSLVGLLSVSGELSINPSFSVVAETNHTSFPVFGLSIKGKYQNYNLFDEGEKISEVNMFYSSGTVYAYQPIHKSLNLGFSLQQEYYWGDVFRNTSSESDIDEKSDFFITNAIANLSFDNMDDFYFPSKGTNLYTEFSGMFDFSVDQKFSSALLIKSRNVIPLTEKTVLNLDFYGRGIFNAIYPQPKSTLIGGEPFSHYLNYHLPFTGLPSVYLANRYTGIGLVGYRVQLSKNHYATALFNVMLQTNELVPFGKINDVYGTGVKYSVKTFLGPLEIAVGYSDLSDGISFAANFGYWF